MKIRRCSEGLNASTIFIHWIPSHLDCGGQRIQGNEAADAIAKKARDSDTKEISVGDLCTYDQISDMSASLVWEIEKLFKNGTSNDDVGLSNPLQMPASQQDTV